MRLRKSLFARSVKAKDQSYSCFVHGADELRLLFCALKVKDRATWSHCRRVSAYAAAVARQLDMSSREIGDVRLAGELHDIGKLVVPTQLLQKTGTLSLREYEIVMQHTIVGAEIVQPLCQQFPVVIDVVRWHHERVDGAGSNDQLGGNNIPLAARIVAVADAFDAMTSLRPYRGPTSLDAALSELEVHAGTQFDPCCVRALRTSFNQTFWLSSVCNMRIHHTDARETSISC